MIKEGDIGGHEPDEFLIDRAINLPRLISAVDPEGKAVKGTKRGKGSGTGFGLFSPAVNPDDVRNRFSGLGIRFPDLNLQLDPSRQYVLALCDAAIKHYDQGNGRLLYLLVTNPYFITAGNLGFGSEGRVISHLSRMADPRRSSAEHCFVELFLEHISKYVGLFGKEANKLLLDPTYDAEFTSVYPMFWTLAPYVFKSLTERGYTDFRSFCLVMEWSRKAGEIGRLPGIFLSNNDEFYLSPDSSDVSHQIASSCANLLVKNTRVFDDISADWCCSPEFYDRQITVVERQLERDRLIRALKAIAGKKTAGA